MKQRIGIFRGTFDPIHQGHIAFAEAALSEAKLDKVYFLLEKAPKYKSSVSNIKQRQKILAQSLTKHDNLHFLADIEVDGYIKDVLPKLKDNFSDSILIFLMGSDIAKTIQQWPDAEALCDGNELVIGLRKDDQLQQINSAMEALSKKPAKYWIIKSPMPELTSSDIRKLAD